MALIRVSAAIAVLLLLNACAQPTGGAGDPRSQEEIPRTEVEREGFEVDAAGPFIVEDDGVWVISRDHRESLRLTRLDTDTGQLVKVGRLGEPFAGDLVGVGDEIWTLSHRWDDSGGPTSGALERWDRTTLELVERIRFDGARPTELAVANGGVWVSVPAGEGPDEAWKLDVRSAEVLQRVTVGAEASEILVEGDSLFVSDGLDEQVIELDARTGDIRRRHPVELCGSGAMAVEGDRLWTLTCDRDEEWSGDRDSVQLIDLSSGEVIWTRGLGGSLSHIVHGDGALWVLDARDHVMMSLDAATGEGSGVEVEIPATDSPPTSLVLTAGELWVTSMDGVLTRIVLETRS
jgi:outer membrane protein assembly factor BamB